LLSPTSPAIARTDKKGRAAAGQANTYALSSLLVCGHKKTPDGPICNAPLVIHGGSARRYALR
jgi:hypothetical protein